MYINIGDPELKRGSREIVKWGSKKEGTKGRRRTSQMLNVSICLKGSRPTRSENAPFCLSDLVKINWTKSFRQQQTEDLRSSFNFSQIVLCFWLQGYLGMQCTSSGTKRGCHPQLWYCTWWQILFYASRGEQKSLLWLCREDQIVVSQQWSTSAS